MIKEQMQGDELHLFGLQGTPLRQGVVAEDCFFQIEGRCPVVCYSDVCHLY